jgi:hypothetical protein
VVAVIDYNFEPDILSYYIGAIKQASIPTENICPDDMLDLIIPLINDKEIELITQNLNDLLNILAKNPIRTLDREYAVTYLAIAFQFKLNNHQEEKQQFTPPKSIKIDSKRFHYEFSSDINAFLLEQLPIEDQYQKILESIAKFEKALTLRLENVSNEKYFQEKKRNVLNNSIKAIQEFNLKNITLPKLLKKIHQQYEASQLIPHDSVGAALLGIFGASSSLTKLLGGFIGALTKQINTLNYAVNNCKKTSFSPILHTRKLIHKSKD